MKKFTISLTDRADDTVEAASFDIDRDWVTFTDANHKMVAIYPARRIEGIKAEPAASHGVSITVGGTTTIL